MRNTANDAFFARLVRQAADRYAVESITAREFARSKLRVDPVYQDALSGGVLPSGGTLLDIGCGQGLMLALLVEAGEMVRASAWPATRVPPPQFDRLAGIETRPRMAELARTALGTSAEILQADARSLRLEPCSAALLFDVLQMMSPDEQESLLSSVSKALAPSGVILVREADASAGWRFAFVRIGNRIKALCVGTWRQRVHYRSRDEWLACFRRLGFEAELCPTNRRNPLANVLFRLRMSRNLERE